MTSVLLFATYPESKVKKAFEGGLVRQVREVCKETVVARDFKAVIVKSEIQARTIRVAETDIVDVMGGTDVIEEKRYRDGREKRRAARNGRTRSIRVQK